jgi:uncharacterized membrane-anchored protein
VKIIATHIKLITLFLIFYSYSFHVQALTEQDLEYTKGPSTGNILDRATIKINKNQIYFNEENSKKYNEILQNLQHGRENILEGRGWTAYFTFAEEGYIKDQEDLDANELLSQNKRNEEEGNKLRKEKGWTTMNTKGWFYEPRYNSDTRQLEWAFLIETDEGDLVNYNTRILARNGYMRVVVAVTPDNFNANISEIKNALNSVTYNKGEKYSDFKQGDRVAEYGLAALIAGGAAAVATKKGFWALIAGFFGAAWKIIGILFILILTKIGSIFRWLKSLFTNK